MAKRKSLFERLGLDWQTMEIGAFVYKGTHTGAKANACRANKSYAPKKWVTYKKDKKTYVERVE